MKLLGFEITRVRDQKKSLSPVDNRGGWWPIVRESFAGAWQANVTVSMEDALQYWAVFRCVSLIAGDIAKMRVKLVEQKTIGGIWTEINDDTYSRLLAKPNRKQTRIQFYRNWMESKLTRGNTYVLKERDTRGKVVALYILDPNRCIPLVNEFGDVFYELMRDDFLGLQGHRMVVPASEIIHDRWNTLYHPLVGLSPIYAAGINSLTALSIERNSARLFKNSARPGGVLTAPHNIPDETAKRLKAYFEENFTGDLAGKVAVLGDGLTYASMTMNAVDAQLIDQLKWNDVAIAGIFGAPAYMINAGTAPAYNNVEALNQAYYSQALQTHVEDIELLLDEGLELDRIKGRTIGTEFDLDGLLRMDTATLVKTAGDGVMRAIYTPDEARAKLGLPPVPGGDTPYLQEQNYSLAALPKRDAKEDPFAGPTPPPEPKPAAGDDPAEGNEDDQTDAAKQAFEEAMAA
jgi:HK97 family phage portal protein